MSERQFSVFYILTSCFGMRKEQTGHRVGYTFFLAKDLNLRCECHNSIQTDTTFWILAHLNLFESLDDYLHSDKQK